MTTLSTGRPGAVEIVSDIAKADEGTALLMVELLTYDALCNEVDRIQPQLDRDVSRLMAKRAEGALEHVAKRYSVAKSAHERAELEDLAESLLQIVTVSKDTDDNPQTPWWDARDESGRFKARGLRGSLMRSLAGASADAQGKGKVVGGLNLFGPEDAQTKQELGQGFQNIKDSNRYTTARALGRGLEQVQQPHARAVGSLVRMVGDIGPEAERVFGHGLTRLAYRYRGTERRADPGYDHVIQTELRRETKRLNTTDQGVPTSRPVELPDQDKLSIITNNGARFLWKSVPNQKLAEISLDSGKLPPSRGIIFDADGHPVSESVGFNGDHYLPFDLKNLKRLRGGSYVRTRTTGGLTDEDIYTGLLTGARQVTVISNSGVFSVEFDPSLRGGRRYSDKARQMVDRYSKLVRSIGSGKLVAQDLTPEQKAEERQKAYRKANGNEALAREFYQNAVKQKRFESQFTMPSEEKLRREALQEAKQLLAEQQRAGQVSGVSGRTLGQLQAELFRKKRNTAYAQVARNYRLDADGYKAAQDALQQEFPFFIRSAPYQPLDVFLDRNKLLGDDEPLPPRPGKDIGYAARNSLTQGKQPPAEETAQPRQSGSTDRTAESRQGRRAGDERPAEDQPWTAVGKEYQRDAEKPLADALFRSMKVRHDLDNDAWTPKPEGEISDNEAKGLSDLDQWSDWLLQKPGGVEGAAKFLVTADPDHLRKAIRALNRYQPNASHRPEYDGFDEARQIINGLLVTRKPFADPAPAGADPYMVDPGAATDVPAPAPVQDIVDIGPDLDGLRAYAQDHPEIALNAQRILDTPDHDAKTAKSVAEKLRRLHTLEKWPRPNGEFKEDHRPVGGGTYAEARLFHEPGGRESLPVYQELVAEQQAWALARATEVAAAVEGTEVPELAPKEEVAHRAPRGRTGSPLVVRKRQSLIARPRPSSPSSLEAVLAKRLASDPHYLEWLQSAHR